MATTVDFKSLEGVWPLDVVHESRVGLLKREQMARPGRLELPTLCLEGISGCSVLDCIGL
jgi:hypothetical protein